MFVLYLWDCQACNSESRDEIRPQKPEVVIRSPLENGEEELKPQNQLVKPSLVLELMKWIIREKCLRKLMHKFLKSGFVGW